MMIEEETVIPYSSYSSVDLTSGKYMSVRDADTDFSIDEAFSISMWIKPIQEGGNTITVLQKGTGDDGYRIQMTNNAQANPELIFTLGLGASYYWVKSADDEGINNASQGGKLWHNFYYHIVCTYDGSESTGGMTIYINGTKPVLTTATVGSPLINNSDSIFVANGYSLGFASMRVYSKELTNNEAISLYNSGTPKYTGVTSPVTEVTVLKDFSSGYFQGCTTADIKEENTFPANRPKGKFYLSDRNSISIHAYGIWGETSGDDRPEAYASPLHGVLFAPVIWHDSDDNETLIATMQRGHPGFRRDGAYIKVDHDNDLITHVSNLIAPDSLNRDNHQVHTIMKTKDGEYLSAREDGHISFIYNAKGTLESIADIGTTGASAAYTNIVYIQDTLLMFYRFGSIGSQPPRQFMSKSNDDGETWATHQAISQGNSDQAMYPHTAIAGDSLIYFFDFARSTSGNFKRIDVFKTRDGINFYGLDETLVATWGSDVVDPSDFITYCFVDSITNPTTYNLGLLDSAIDTAGNLHMVYHDWQADSTIYAGWNGTGWTMKNLPVPSFENQTFDTGALIYRGDTSWDLFKIETRSGFDVIVKYSTTDAFDTIDAGTVVSKTDKNYSYIAVTHNKELGKPIVVTGSEIDNENTETAHLWIYTYTP